MNSLVAGNMLLCCYFYALSIPSKLINSFLKIIYTSALFPVKLQFHITNFRVILGKRKKTKTTHIRYATSFVMTSDVELLIMINFMGWNLACDFAQVAALEWQSDKY